MAVNKEQVYASAGVWFEKPGFNHKTKRTKGEMLALPETTSKIVPLALLSDTQRVDGFLQVDPNTAQLAKDAYVFSLHFFIDTAEQKSLLRNARISVYGEPLSWKYVSFIAPAIMEEGLVTFVHDPEIIEQAGTKYPTQPDNFLMHQSNHSVAFRASEIVPTNNHVEIAAFRNDDVRKIQLGQLPERYAPAKTADSQKRAYKKAPYIFGEKMLEQIVAAKPGEVVTIERPAAARLANEARLLVQENTSMTTTETLIIFGHDVLYKPQQSQRRIRRRQQPKEIASVSDMEEKHVAPDAVKVVIFAGNIPPDMPVSLFPNAAIIHLTHAEVTASNVYTDKKISYRLWKKMQEGALRWNSQQRKQDTSHIDKDIGTILQELYNRTLVDKTYTLAAMSSELGIGARHLRRWLATCDITIPSKIADKSSGYLDTTSPTLIQRHMQRVADRWNSEQLAINPQHQSLSMNEILLQLYTESSVDQRIPSTDDVANVLHIHKQTVSRWLAIVEIPKRNQKVYTILRRTIANQNSTERIATVLGTTSDSVRDGLQESTLKVAEIAEKAGLLPKQVSEIRKKYSIKKTRRAKRVYKYIRKTPLPVIQEANSYHISLIDATRSSGMFKSEKGALRAARILEERSQLSGRLSLREVAQQEGLTIAQISNISRKGIDAITVVLEARKILEQVAASGRSLEDLLKDTFFATSETIAVTEKLLHKRFIELKSVAEITSEMHIKKEAVETILTRAIAKLHTALL